MCRMRHVLMLGIGLAVAGIVGAMLAAPMPMELGFPILIAGMVLFVVGAVMTFVAVLRRQT